MRFLGRRTWRSLERGQLRRRRCQRRGRVQDEQTKRGRAKKSSTTRRQSGGRKGGGGGCSLNRYRGRVCEVDVEVGFG